MTTIHSFQSLELVTLCVRGGGCGISMEITALTLPGLSQSHRLVFTFITAASAFPWVSQRNQLHQKPLSVLANGYPSTYPNGLRAPCPKLCVLITSGLQDKFLHGSPQWGGLTLFGEEIKVYANEYCTNEQHIRLEANGQLIRHMVVMVIRPAQKHKSDQRGFLCDLRTCHICLSSRNNFSYPPEIAYGLLMTNTPLKQAFCLQATARSSFVDENPFILHEESSSLCVHLHWKCQI